MFSALSGSLHMTDAPIPSPAQWPFDRPPPVFQCLGKSIEGPLFWGAETTTKYSRCALARVTQRRITLNLLVKLFVMQHRCCWPPLHQGHIAGSFSISCPPGILEPFLQSCFPAKHSPACMGECPRFLPPQVQDLAFLFAQLQEKPDPQPLNIPLNGSATTQYINHRPIFVSSANLLRMCFIPSIIQTINEDVK